VRNFRQALLEISAGQDGYFTARQALAAGYSYRSQHYHTAVGDWTRLGRGIFRRADNPPSEREDLIILSLWKPEDSGQ
jgi:hypothetical protein